MAERLRRIFFRPDCPARGDRGNSDEGGNPNMFHFRESLQHRHFIVSVSFLCRKCSLGLLGRSVKTDSPLFDSRDTSGSTFACLSDRLPVFSMECRECWMRLRRWTHTIDCWSDLSLLRWLPLFCGRMRFGRRRSPLMMPLLSPFSV